MVFRVEVKLQQIASIGRDDLRIEYQTAFPDANADAFGERERKSDQREEGRETHG